MQEIKTNDGKKGGWLKGKRHNDKNGNPIGGIKAIVVDTGKPVELEGGEVIINREASKKYWKELSRINQSAGNGVAIGPPGDSFDEDPSEDYEKGGKIEFNANHVPNKYIFKYAEKIKNNHPEIWKLGGNIFGNEAFENLSRVSKRGYWLDSEEWMYVKWRAYVARHKQDFRIESVVAMLKWVDKVDKGWTYMKNLIESKIAEKKEKGGNLIKRADGSYSKHGLWDSIRENAGSGKEPTKEMLEQEAKIKGEKYEVGGDVTDKREIVRKKLLATFDYLPNNLKFLGKGLNGYAFLVDIDNELYVVKYTKSLTEFYLTEMAFVSNPPNVVTIKDVKKISENYEYGIIHKYVDIEGKPNEAVWNVAVGIKFKEYLQKQNSVPLKELNHVKALAKKYQNEIENYFGFSVDVAQSNWGYEDGKLVLFDIDGDVKKSQYEEWIKKHSKNSEKYHLGGNMSKHLAPNGKPSNLNHEQWHLVRTPAFKTWFGDWESLALKKLNDSGIDEVSLKRLEDAVSKVVDENGEPLVVYHGTNEDFTVFDKEKQNTKTGFGDFGAGFYFTASLNTAKYYTLKSEQNRKIISVFLNIKNPFILELNWEKLSESSKSNYKNLKGFYSWQKDIIKNHLQDDYRPSKAITKEFGDYEFQDLLIRNAYDGVFVNRINIFEKPDVNNENQILYLNEIVVFEPNQIKLADGTNTTFDGNNPDIRFKGGGLITYNFDLKANNIIELLKQELIFRDLENRFLNRISKSQTDYGESWYVRLLSPLEDSPFEIRISDHSVQSINRLTDKKYIAFINISSDFDKEDAIILIDKYISEFDFEKSRLEQRYEAFEKMNLIEDYVKEKSKPFIDKIKSEGKAIYYTNQRNFEEIYKQKFPNAESICPLSSPNDDIRFAYVDKNNGYGKFYTTRSYFNELVNLGEIVAEKVPLTNNIQQLSNIDLPFISQFKDGGPIELPNCIDFIKKSEAIKNNGYYFEFKNLLLSLGAYDIEVPKIDSLVLITYNSGGQKSVNAIDTINSIELANNLSKLLKVDIAIARILVHEQMINSKRFEIGLIDEISNKNIVVADRDKIVCTSFWKENKAEKSPEKFMKWYIDWHKGISDKMNIYFSLPNQISPFKEKNIVVLDIFEKIDQNIDAKKYLNKIIEKADEYGITIYLEPKPRHKYILNDVDKVNKISKDYLIEYYQKFGFKLTSDKNFMKRLPNSSLGIRFEKGGTTNTDYDDLYQVYIYEHNEPIKVFESYNINEAKSVLNEQKRLGKKEAHIQYSFAKGGNVDQKDSVTMDIPLLIRTLELSREDIHSDVELHQVVENLIALKNKPVLTMDDYNYIANIKHKHIDKMKQGGQTEMEKEKIHKVMHEFKQGELHSGSKRGPLVTDRKQAIAIALSESRKLEFGGNVDSVISEAEKGFSKDWISSETGINSARNLIWGIINNPNNKNYVSNTNERQEALELIFQAALHYERLKNDQYSLENAKKYEEILRLNETAFIDKFDLANYHYNDYLILTVRFKNGDSALFDLATDLRRVEQFIPSKNNNWNREDDIKYWLSNALIHFDNKPLLMANLMSSNKQWTNKPKGMTKTMETIIDKSSETETSISLNILSYKNPYELNRAIERLLDLKGEERDEYSPDEISFIGYYSGYGGLEKQGKFEINELKGLLYEYFTPDAVVQKMWGLAYKYGYGTIGDNSVFEPSTGVGAFIKYVPFGVRVAGNEINKYSAKICKILYPNAHITLQPFEKNFIKNNLSIKENIQDLPKYSMLIGNPPYGELKSKFIGMGEDKFTTAQNWIEYFIVRGLDMLHPGGLLIYIVGAEQRNGGTLFLDSKMSKVKQMIFDKAELLDAYRLPVNIFERTGVSSEILVFKKR